MHITDSAVLYRSDEVQSCDKTPLEIMCAYLLDNKLDEPEYDHVSRLVYTSVMCLIYKLRSEKIVITLT